tara:strand:- start:1318 stop:2151 length:834 start_codon:yes stop_codon:yes gene_type:complete
MNYENYPRNAFEDRRRQNPWMTNDDGTLNEDWKQKYGSNVDDAGDATADAEVVSDIKQAADNTGVKNLGDGWDNSSNPDNQRSREEKSKQAALIQQHGGKGWNNAINGLLTDRAGLPIAAGALGIALGGEGNNNKLKTGALAAGGAFLLQQMMSANNQQNKPTESVILDKENAEISAIDPSASQVDGLEIGDQFVDPKANQSNTLNTSESQEASISQSLKTGFSGENMQPNIATLTPGVEAALNSNMGPNPNDADQLVLKYKQQVPGLLYKSLSGLA